MDEKETNFFAGKLDPRCDFDGMRAFKVLCSKVLSFVCGSSNFSPLLFFFPPLSSHKFHSVLERNSGKREVVES